MPHLVTPVPATAASVRAAVARASTEPRRPYHLGVAIGVTTGAYALSLLVASSLQFEHDRALIADRQPVADAIDVLGDHHDDMALRLDAARAAYSTGADGYGALIVRLDTLRERLAAMDATVTAIEANSALAASIPGVPGASPLRRSVVERVRRLAGVVERQRVVRVRGRRTAPRTVPAVPPPVAQPPVSGSTGASGAP